VNEALRMACFTDNISGPEISALGFKTRLTKGKCQWYGETYI
jgi:hypothetical protein